MTMDNLPHPLPCALALDLVQHTGNKQEDIRQFESGLIYIGSPIRFHFVLLTDSHTASAVRKVVSLIVPAAQLHQAAQQSSGYDWSLGTKHIRAPHNHPDIPTTSQDNTHSRDLRQKPLVSYDPFAQYDEDNLAIPPGRLSAFVFYPVSNIKDTGFVA